MNGKINDDVNSCRDLQDLGIRHELHVKVCGDKLYLLAAPHTLPKAEKQLFCKMLFNLKMPDDYCSNISNCISLSDCKLVGLKSHNCHVLMQQLLLVAIRGLLPKWPIIDMLLFLMTFVKE
ncbi:hypothetical protein ACOSQ3_009835 [Xanthoceras sorbifolium]